MAKTPLLRAFKKTFTDIRTASSLGIDIEQLHERRASQWERGIDRREFLRYSAAGAAALALPKWSLAKTTPQIVIVGAGIAGLTCALDLRDQGIRAEIYEASNRVGGRMLSSRPGYWSEGQISEWGGELIDSNHTTVRDLAQRFNLALDDLHAAQPPGSDEVYRFFQKYYPKKTVDSDFSKIFAALQADVAAVAQPTTFDSFTDAGKALDNMSLREWIEARIPGGHNSPLGRLLDVAYTIEYGADTVDQSALNLISMLGTQPDKNGKTMATFGESDERFHIRGGNEQLPRAIAAQLGDGNIHYGMQLVSLRKNGDKYRLQFESKGQSRRIDADFVVLAVPFAVLRKLDIARAGFDERKMQAIREQGVAQNAKLQLQFRDRPWNGKGPWPGVGNGSTYADTGYQSSWEVTRAQAGKSGILNFFHGGTPVSSMTTRTPFGTAKQPSISADATRALNYAEIVLPGLMPLWNNKANLSLWHLHPLTQCSYSYYRVGQYTRFGGYEKARQGGVLFCGEHTSSEFQGFMEGGAAEGKRAAAELMTLIGTDSESARAAK